MIPYRSVTIRRWIKKESVRVDYISWGLGEFPIAIWTPQIVFYACPLRQRRKNSLFCNCSCFVMINKRMLRWDRVWWHEKWSETAKVYPLLGAVAPTCPNYISLHLNIWRETSKVTKNTASIHSKHRLYTLSTGTKSSTVFAPWKHRSFPQWSRQQKKSD